VLIDPEHGRNDVAGIKNHAKMKYARKRNWEN
jgi:hypothetical protein